MGRDIPSNYFDSWIREPQTNNNEGTNGKINALYN